MLKLYYAPGACSLASHIALEEAGAAYDLHAIALAKGEQSTEAYLKINPNARVPALDTGHGAALTENVAILTYIARTHPQAKLMPEEPEGMARCLSLLVWFASSVHIAFSRFNRPYRFSNEEPALAGIKAKGKDDFFDFLKKIDGLLAGRDYFLGEFSAADTYGVVFYAWGRRAGLPLDELRNYTAHKNRMIARPAVKRALAQEGIDLA
jgi:glutathione S-transferase